MSSMFKIFVGNISFETTEDKLRRIFEPHMEIEDLVIARDTETGKSKGYGFVMTRDTIRGRRALTQIGKFFIDGRLAYTKEAHNGKPGKPARGGARGGRRRVSHRPRPMRRSFASGNASARPTTSSNGNGNGAHDRSSGGYTGTRDDAASQPVSRGYVGLNEEQSPDTSPTPGNNVASDQSPKSR